jgi:formylglycine-generating enzyme required for sulfatase activity
MTLVFIPPGTFTMGSPENEPSREKQEVPHRVTLTKGFYLGRYEVTVGQFRQFVADTKYRTDGERDGIGAYGSTRRARSRPCTPASPGRPRDSNRRTIIRSWTSRGRTRRRFAAG